VHPGHRRGVSAASGTLRISHKFVAAAAAAAAAPSAVSTPPGAAAAAAANAAHSFSCESPYNRSVLKFVSELLCIKTNCSCVAVALRLFCVLAE
jgi:hypothetical protein